VCVKCQIKIAGIFGIIAVDIGDCFFLDTVRVSHSATVFKHVDIFVWAGCRRSIIFVLIQVIHFIFIARYIMLIMI